ncbi:alpha/beta hydrolase [Shimia sp. R11_0]|uniref:alpha/beta fold hydrolase n=1 Tax=Shimia sp. R11_0 TaxID=2821096 RepID=UPI001ADB1202|nr:alpha/beta fold hydrolase [Shimia sp. R11_0]MBO9477660.1 alpha/beta hydrolase [Shimia sp. R11_0]
MTDRFAQLTHLVYEASLDNSLWPELILELTEEVQRARESRYLDDPEAGADGRALENLSRHFRRAFSISERMVGLQERETYLSSILNAFSFGVALLDDEGQVLMANRALQDVLPNMAAVASARPLISVQTGHHQSLADSAKAVNKSGQAQEFRTHFEGPANLMLLPRTEAARIGFPAVAASVLISTGTSGDVGLMHVAQKYQLTRRETELLQHVGQPYDLREIGQKMGISYESARTYLKRVYEKTGTNSRSDLASNLARSPLTALRVPEPAPADARKVRFQMTLPDGRQLEYFRLGPAQGRPVLVFDALSGVTIDMIGYPDHCGAVLERLGIQLITPCRPGSFLSDAKEMQSLGDFAPDVAALLDHLGFETVSVLSVSFGSGSALAVAHALKERVQKLVLSSATYPVYRHENWRELDQFYHMSSILGRHWPAMLRQIIPFLVRSILQNRDRYFDRYCNRSRSMDDIRILSHPVIRRRTAEMLALRTAAGMQGMVDENLLNTQGWDFDVSEIDVPTEIYQGPDDNVAPLQGAEMLARHMPQARLSVLFEKGHYHHIENWPWLVARAAGLEMGPDSITYRIPDL